MEVLPTLRARRRVLGSVETFASGYGHMRHIVVDHAAGATRWGDRTPFLSCDQSRRKYPKST